MTDKVYQVYWLHLADHTDILTEGYVGITSKTATERFHRHCVNSEKGHNYNIHHAIRKYGKSNIIVDVVCITDDGHARWLERKLRPEPFIGWNMQCGGIGNPYLTPEQREAKKLKRLVTIEQKGGLPSGEDHHNWKGGISEAYLRRNGLFVKKTKEELISNAKERVRIFNESGGVWAASRPEVRKQFSDAHKKRFEENGWWVNSQANHKLWLAAAKVMLFRKITALPRSLLAQMIGVPESSVGKLTDKLYAGWNPLEDHRWIKYYEQNKAEGDPTVEELTILLRQSQCIVSWP